MVELGEGPTDDLVFLWGEIRPVAKLTIPDLDFGSRARLASGPRPVGEQWFRYDTGTDQAFASAAKAVQALLPQMEAWFRGERPQHNIQD